MKFWSKGLGRRSLTLAIGTETIESDGKQILLSGEVVEPVSWRYIMFLPAEDWVDFFRAALRPQAATYLCCRKRMRVLAWLTGFLLKFTALYALALLRVAIGRAAEPTGVITALPDLSAQAEIEAGTLQ